MGLNIELNGWSRVALLVGALGGSSVGASFCGGLTPLRCLWQAGDYEMGWENFHNANFEVTSFKVDTGECTKLAAVDSCNYVEAIESRNVRKPKDLQDAIYNIKRCNAQNFGPRSARKCPPIKYEVEVVIPPTDCLNGLWGFDFGFNPGDYGMALKEVITIQSTKPQVGDAADGALSAAALTAELVTLPLSTRSSYVYDIQTYSGPPGSSSDLPKPSQEQRCDFALKYGRPSRVVDVSESGGITKVTAELGKGTMFFKVDKWDAAIDKRNKQFKLSLYSLEVYEQSVSTIPKVPLFSLPGANTGDGIRTRKFYPKLDVKSGCTAGSLERPRSCADMLASFREFKQHRNYTEFLLAENYCRTVLQDENEAECAATLSIGVTVPLKRYQSREENFLGFDLGVNLGDYGLELKSGAFYVRPHIGTRVKAVRSLDLATYLPTLDKFGYVKLTEQQRGAVAASKVAKGVLVFDSRERIDSMDDWKAIILEKDGNIGGTTLISLEGPERSYGNQDVHMVLTRSKTARRTEFPIFCPKHSDA